MNRVIIRRVRPTTARCSQLELVGDRARARFQTDLRLSPGQFALARLAQTADPYLRQAFFPSSISSTGFTVDLAAADPALRWLAPGNEIDLLGPVGAALPDFPARSRVLLVAEDDPGPLLPLAFRAVAQAGAATLLLATRYPLEALDPEIELRVGDLAALTAEYAPAADLVFIHAGLRLHAPILQALTQVRSFVPAHDARALISGPMPCGVGACGACYIKTARGWKMACVDGPFFSIVELET